MKLKLLTTCVSLVGCIAIPASAQIIFLQDGSQQDAAPPSHHGGFNSGVAGSYSFVGGGTFNEGFDYYAVIFGGSYNGGGSDDLNLNTSRYATDGGGDTNVAYGEWSVVHGGQGRIAKAR